MAKETGARTDERLERLLAAPARAPFFEALLLLEQLYGDAPRLGELGPVKNERVRLRPSPDMAFPAADLEAAETLAGGRIQLTTTFFGLYGVDSPLPSAYAERVCKAAGERSGDRVRAFVDIFHHRLLSLLFRAWKKYRPARPNMGDPLTACLDALTGEAGGSRLGTARRRSALAEARTHVARSRGVVGLEQLLRRRMGHAVNVLQLQRRRAELPRDQRTRLGRSSARLGGSLVVGARINDRNRIRITVGCVAYADFIDLAPGGVGWEAMDDALGAYLRAPIDHELAVELRSAEIPPSVLGHGCRLARNTWLSPPVEPVVELVFRSQSESSPRSPANA